MSSLPTPLSSNCFERSRISNNHPQELFLESLNAKKVRKVTTATNIGEVHVHFNASQRIESTSPETILFNVQNNAGFSIEKDKVNESRGRFFQEAAWEQFGLQMRKMENEFEDMKKKFSAFVQNPEVEYLVGELKDADDRVGRLGSTLEAVEDENENLKTRVFQQGQQIEYQRQLIDDLLQRINSQGTTIEEQASQVEELKSINIVQSKTIEEMAFKIEEQASKIEEQALKIEEQGLKIEELALKIEELATRINQQDRHIAQQASRIVELEQRNIAQEQQNRHQTAFNEQLLQRIEEQERQIQFLMNHANRNT
eukprot:CAMPEP_0170087138 /NCGR_PEP_ID=MMETSP0019_2-20121128/21684_1 /TAXON_ID=98059 /ORGANISM="Dinobryon sp., Strain UTEXLB2267" /LENGTH=312 /DNA_ID=CAMNT_0010304625 /DNA_START=34 /DNA_END=972 /DNA_ORIENTATION=+